jgi:hypothetical protein
MGGRARGLGTRQKANPDKAKRGVGAVRSRPYLKIRKKEQKEKIMTKTMRGTKQRIAVLAVLALLLIGALIFTALQTTTGNGTEQAKAGGVVCGSCQS